nr:UDP-N-acetyl-D-mannosaminuronic acid transferase [arsenite-oxidising bacterium NT-25]
MREANSPDQDCVPVFVQPSSLTDGRAADRPQTWNATLAALEAMIFGQATGTSVSFDEDVLRSDRGPLGAVSRLRSLFLAPRLRRLWSWRSGRWNCSASELVPSLLTFVERPLRIIVIGRTADDLASAGRHLKAHAPWHSYTMADLAQLRDLPHSDLALIAIPNISAEDRLRLSVASVTLKLFCGTTPERLVARMEPLQAAPPDWQNQRHRKAA